MHYIIAQIISVLKRFIKNPLSILRISLPILFVKKILESFQYTFYLEFDNSYSLSKTWFLNLVPDAFFNLSQHDFTLMKYAILVSGICAVVGLFGRLNLLFLAFVGFFIFGMGEAYGIFDHHMSLPCQIMFAMALVPGSMKNSIDDWLINLYNKSKIQTEAPKWGIQLVLLLVVLTYFSAGISKLRYGHGLNWLDGSTLGFYLKERTDSFKNGSKQILFSNAQLNQKKLWKDEFGFVAHTYGNYQTLKKWNNIADYIASNKFLIILLSVGSLLFELLGFVVFLNTKYRNLYLVFAIIFHMSIGQLMGISFRQYRLICFCLLDWNAIFKYVMDYVNKFNAIRRIMLLPLIKKSK